MSRFGNAASKFEERDAPLRASDAVRFEMSPAPASSGGARRLTLAQAQELIEPLLPKPHLTVVQIAKQLGVSRPTLYKLFVEHGGVERYFQARRLELVAAALSDPDDATSIGDLANRWGFSEIAHLSRSFRRRYDLSPTAYRRSARLGGDGGGE